jgi:hypothetical protein
MTGRIFQALPCPALPYLVCHHRQRKISARKCKRNWKCLATLPCLVCHHSRPGNANVTENVWPPCPALPCLSPQTDTTMFAFIYKMRVLCKGITWLNSFWDVKYMVSKVPRERHYKNKGLVKGGAKCGPNSSNALTQGPYNR